MQWKIRVEASRRVLKYELLGVVHFVWKFLENIAKTKACKEF